MSFSLLLSLAGNTLGCTIFNASNADTVLVGNNEDWNDTNTGVCFLPAEKGKFGRIFFGYFTAFPQGGMNERGLFYDAVRVTNITYAPPVSKKLNYKGNLAEKILEECSTVDQAIILYRKYNEPNLGYAKFMFVDKNGVSAIIGWDWSENDISIVRKKNNYQLLGVGEWTLQQLFKKDNQNITVERFRTMLEASRQQYKTVYSNIYDLKNGEVYVYNQSNYDYVVKFKFADELRKGKHFDKLSELFPKNQKNFVVNYQKNVYSTTHRIIIFFFMVVLFSPFIKYPTAYCKRIRKHKTDEPVQNKRISLVARLVVVSNCIIALLLLYYITQYALLISKYGLSIFGLSIGLFPIIMTILITGEIIFLIILWQRKYWMLSKRIYYIFLIFTQVLEIILLVNLGNVIKL